MRHHILVKWNSDLPRPDYAPIADLFHKALDIPGRQQRFPASPT